MLTIEFRENLQDALVKEGFTYHQLDVDDEALLELAINNLDDAALADCEDNEI